MKKFFLLHYGYETPTPEIMDAWSKWFTSFGDRFDDSGTGFVSGREITHNGTRELTPDSEAITGYSILNAENIEEAEKIAQDCPFITGIRVYETRSMAG
jgi:hypothetical protein